MTKATGEMISIDDSAYDGLKSLTVYGNTTQNLWVNPSGTQNGVTVTANADGSITLSGTPTSNTWIYLRNIFILRPGSTYTFSVNDTVSNGNAGFYIDIRNSDNTNIVSYYIGGAQDAGGNQRTFTVPSNAASAFFGFGLNNVSASIEPGTYRVMLNEGSEAEPWCPPGLNSVGDGGSVEVVTAGKNLLEPQAYLGGYSYGFAIGYRDEEQRTEISLPYTTTANYQGVAFYFEAKAGNNYTFTQHNAPSGASIKIQQFYPKQESVTSTSPGKYTGAYANQSVLSGTTLTFENDGLVVVLSSLMEPGTATWPADFGMQVELGSTATSYEPPNVTTTSIDLQGHTLNALPDGTRDELHIDGGGNVVLEKRVGVAEAPTAAGSWKWDTNGGGRGMFSLGAAASGLVQAGNGMCDKLPMRLDGESSDTTPSYTVISNALAYAKNPAITSTSTAATVAGGATYIYPLAEPQTVDLGTVELPKLRKKPLANNIWVNGAADGTGFSPAPEIDCEYNRWSTYCDGFKTHGKHSYFDMRCCIAARDTGAPEKKSVTATVPYMSGYYDLSKLYGAIAFEARQLMYRFEFVEDSREELQQKKSQFLEWLSQVHDEEIADDDIPGRHFIGSLSEWEFEEGEEGQSGSLEVTFNCQPFLEADEDTTKTCNVGSNTVTVEGQAVNAYAKTNSGTATIQIGGVTQSVGTTEIRLSVQLQPGDNAVTVTGSPVVLRWKELTV